MAAGITEILLVDGNSQIYNSFSQEVTLRPRVVTAADWERRWEPGSLLGRHESPASIASGHPISTCYSVNFILNVKKQQQLEMKSNFPGENMNKIECSCCVNEFIPCQALVSALAWPLSHRRG